MRQSKESKANETKLRRFVRTMLKDVFAIVGALVILCVVLTIKSLLLM